MSNLTDIEFNQNSLEDWQALATKSLHDKSLAELAHITASALPIETLYTTRPKVTQSVPAQALQRWDNRLNVIGGTVELQNASVLSSLKGGVDSLQILIDSPEQPSPINVDQLSTVLANVQQDIIPISLFSGSQFVKSTNEIKSIWSKLGIDSNKLSVSINADPIGTLASTGCLSVELNALIKDMASLAIENHESLLKIRSVCVNSTCYHNAGATIEQELASTIATAAIYLENLIDAGLDPQSANDTIVFQVACDADALSNVVKLRALKQLWIHVAKQFDVTAPHLQLVVETSKRMQSSRAPWVNHLRNVSAATAAAMGGANSIIIHPHNCIDDQFIDDQIELSARVARNIPIILSEESAMTFVHDPMAGSYAVETLTTNLVNSSWQSLQQLETDGGLVKALSTGQWQTAIGASQRNRIERLKHEQDILVGVNKFHGVTTTPPNKMPINKTKQNNKLLVNVQPLAVNRDAIEFED